MQTPYAVVGLHLVAWYLLADTLTRSLTERQRKEAETTTTTALMVSASAFRVSAYTVKREGAAGLAP